jgi:hypothetical protein
MKERVEPSCWSEARNLCKLGLPPQALNEAPANCVHDGFKSAGGSQFAIGVMNVIAHGTQRDPKFAHHSPGLFPLASSLSTFRSCSESDETGAG